MSVKTRYVGSYGLCVSGGRVLLVRKARGPYRGLLDLPGGGIEHGETPRETVRREFAEETGLCVEVSGLACEFSHVACYVNNSGESEEVHHLGFVWRVSVPDSREPLSMPDGQDSLGAAWYALLTLDRSALSPPVLTALTTLPGAGA